MSEENHKERYGEGNCSSCTHFDLNDYMHAWGTCEILDEDFHVTHECSCPVGEIQLVERLQRERDSKINSPSDSS